MKMIFFLSILFVLNSCSFRARTYHEFSAVGEPVSADYIDHLASAGDDYLKSEETKEIKLHAESVQYLEQFYDRIISNNEILLSRGQNPSFHFIVNRTPFIFSLPRAQFFLSTGLVEKYLKSEELFVAAVAAEILKSNRNIYEKRIMVPLGFYSTEKMIQLTRLKPETKYLVNEWCYFVLKRAGYDPSAYLNWIQVQNRNTLDFSLFLGDAVGISKEEQLFKNFMARQGIASVEKKINEANSSKPFYKLLNNIASTR